MLLYNITEGNMNIKQFYKEKQKVTQQGTSSPVKFDRMK